MVVLRKRGEMGHFFTKMCLLKWVKWGEMCVFRCFCELCGRSVPIFLLTLQAEYGLGVKA